MKKFLPFVITLAGIILSTNVYSATYPGQACQPQRGKQIYYDFTGAKNTGNTYMWVSCPLTRHNDSGTGGIAPVFYFVNDGKLKTCYLDNVNIDTGYVWKWTSRRAVRRLALPVLSPTKAWSPVVFNCQLPPGSKVTGYYIAE